MKLTRFNNRGQHCTDVSSSQPKVWLIVTVDLKLWPLNIWSFFSNVWLKETIICGSLCLLLDPSDPTTAYTKAVCEKENRGRTTGREQRQQQPRGLQGLDPDKENRYYRRPARRTELRLGEDRRAHHGQGTLCFLQQIHRGEGRICTKSPQSGQCVGCITRWNVPFLHFLPPDDHSAGWSVAPWALCVCGV